MVTYWVSLLAISILLYVLLDGFDLGIGILFGLTRDEARRHAMWAAVAPIWDGNETWLVVTAVILWGAFPAVYAILMSAFYLPLVVMLSALILRGVAFEFRYKAERMRWIWDFSFFGGSLVATFVQGMTVGALVEGLPITNGQYTGGDFGWFSPFAVLCGVGLVFRLHASWRLLAGQKMRWGRQGRCLSPDPLSCRSDCWSSSLPSSRLHWLRISRSCIDGSNVPISSSFRPLLRWRRSCLRSASSAIGTDCRFTWLR